jgi:hypothetical protein
VWVRACKFVWPFIIVLSSIRAIIMLVDLQRGQSNIEWECDNGGQLWTASADAGYATGSSFPSAFCTTGFSSLNTAFIFGLLIDIVCQVRKLKKMMKMLMNE